MRHHSMYNNIIKVIVLGSPWMVEHTLNGRIGKVVSSHAAVARSIPAEVTLIYTVHEALRGYCP